MGSTGNLSDPIFLFWGTFIVASHCFLFLAFWWMLRILCKMMLLCFDLGREFKLQTYWPKLGKNNRLALVRVLFSKSRIQ